MARPRSSDRDTEAMNALPRSARSAAGPIPARTRATTSPTRKIRPRRRSRYPDSLPVVFEPRRSSTDDFWHGEDVPRPAAPSVSMPAQDVTLQPVATSVWWRRLRDVVRGRAG